MKHMRRLAVMLLMLGLCMPAMAIGAGAPEYEVVLPDGYAQGERYPAAYILPQDGLAGDDGGIAQRLAQAMKEGTCTPMVLVLPRFEAGTDAVAAMQALIEEIDSKYQTLAGKEYRALMGTGAGGYVAYALGLETGLADMLVSVRGDFAGEDNPWIGVYGNLCDRMEEMQLSSPGVFDGYYTYIDAPVDDIYTDMPGSTSDIGALFIGFGTGSAAHEYTVRPGAYTEAFLDESVSRVADRLTNRLFPGEEEPAPVEPVVIDETPVIDGAFQKIELMGEWHFHYSGVDTVLDAANLTKEEFAAWPLVLPGRGHWTKGYGDISDSNVSSAYGPDYFDFFIVGSGYYARTFTLPPEFDSEDVLLSAGYVDDRCEVFLNGVRVGATGMDESGLTTGETTWAVHSLFEIDSDLLVRGGENTIIVRAWNDLPYGAGGWYGGPIGLYSREAYDSLYASKDRFIEESFTSAYAASAQGKKGTIENDYLIYLPKGYEESGRCYPTVYLLHQFNSDHTSYRVDKVDQLFDEGAKEGLFDEMIVVIPNSSGESWWKGDWEKMITEELIPHIDSHYRTIRDARYRLTAGCSMGGQGAFSVALRNPDLFSGSVSFYGAFSYGGANNPNVIAAVESAEYLDYFTLYFICGNQDSYGFGVPAIELHRHLTQKGVNHRFFIDNGGHDGGFYLPNFKDAFAYVRGNMAKPDEGVEEQLTGELAIDGGKIHAQVSALEGIGAYMNRIPASAYTVNESPALSVMLTVEVLAQGKPTLTLPAQEMLVTGDQMSASLEFDLPQDALGEGDTVVILRADVIGCSVVLDVKNI